VLLGTLVPAASAQASFSLGSTVAAPTNTQAGGHYNFNLSYATNGDEDIRNLVTDLPPGLVGNPQAAGFCSPVALNHTPSATCPANSVIGSASSNVTATLPGLGGNVPLSVAGNVYNMIPQGNDPATLGIRLESNTLPPEIVSASPVILIGHASARSSDFGLSTTILDIPRTADVLLLGLIPQTLQIHIDTTSLTLFGNQPGAAQFMTNPTSCGTKTTVIKATSWDGNPATASPTWNSTGCQNEAYHPNLGVTIDMSKDAAHILNPDLTTDVTQGINEANSKRVEAILPSTVQANNEALNHQCTASSFPLDPNVPQSCPANTQVGTAVARTPLLSQPLQGPVYLIQNAGLLPKVGLDLKGPLPARIIGNATPTADLRLDNVFGDVPPGLPDVPLSSFRLTFGGGPGGLIVATDKVCSGPSQYNAVFDSFGGQHVTQQSNAKVIGCGFAKRLSKNRCDHKKLTDVGTKHRDTIRGTKKRDVINGLGGKDKIIGLKGNDLLCGGKGKDKILGGPGKDALFGGPGKDRLNGGPGKDKLAGGPGKDKQKQ
jgi:RTX toxins and related Ca2+-binding proteins